jgi:hypothetical protein
MKMAPEINSIVLENSVTSLKKAYFAPGAKIRKSKSPQYTQTALLQIEK